MFPDKWRQLSGRNSFFVCNETRPKDVKPRTTQVWQEVKEGFSYASGFEPIKAILLMVAL